MLEINNILASASATVQEFNQFPRYGANILLLLMNRLNLVKVELKNGELQGNWKYIDKRVKE